MDLLPSSRQSVLHPFLRGHDWFHDDWPTSERLVNQLFGNELTGPFLHQPYTTVPYWMQPRIRGDQSGVSEVKNDSDRFTVNLDVSQFKPEEVQVTMGENRMVTIEGKHEEQMDEHGFVARHFTRRYHMPKECDLEKVESHLSHDGVLTVTAPKPHAIKEKKKGRVIPIQAAPAKKGGDKPHDEVMNGNGN